MLMRCLYPLLSENEEKTDDSAAVAPVLPASDKDPSEAPKQLEPQVRAHTLKPNTHLPSTVCVRVIDGRVCSGSRR